MATMKDIANAVGVSNFTYIARVAKMIHYSFTIYRHVSLSFL